MRERCGVMAVAGHREAVALVVEGLHALQHRGHESAGVAWLDDEGYLRCCRSPGLVSELMGSLCPGRWPEGQVALGHVRYSTSGDKDALQGVQPLRAGTLALAHNGHLNNEGDLRRELEAHGVPFASMVDSEVLAHLVAGALGGGLGAVLERVEGSYALAALWPGGLLAARDPWGFKPLVLGEVEGAVVVASETCALDVLGGRTLREVRAGEILHLWPHRASAQMASRQPAPCLFELVYFSRPDSITFGRNVYLARKAMGRELAREWPVEADMVVPVPDSGVPVALGYGSEGGLPVEMALFRNAYAGRTFIEPTASRRLNGVRRKLNPMADVVRGRRVVVVDDSLVRGTTAGAMVSLLRRVGAKSVHLRIGAPATTHPCRYGIDMQSEGELMAAQSSPERVGQRLMADSLAYLSVEGLHRAVGPGPFCDLCFGGEDPCRIGREERRGAGASMGGRPSLV